MGNDTKLSNDGGAIVKAPDEMDFSKPELWIVWIKRFERYLSVTGANKKADKEKIDILCYVMGEKSEEILTQILPTLSENTKYDEVKEKFNGYFAPKKNVVFKRFKFNSRIQQADESIDTFVTALHTLAQTCDFGTLKDDLIRDRIVIGVRDVRTSERLQLKEDLHVKRKFRLKKARKFGMNE